MLAVRRGGSRRCSLELLVLTNLFAALMLGLTYDYGLIELLVLLALFWFCRYGWFRRPLLGRFENALASLSRRRPMPYLVLLPVSLGVRWALYLSSPSRSPPCRTNSATNYWRTLFRRGASAIPRILCGSTLSAFASSTSPLTVPCICAASRCFSSLANCCWGASGNAMELDSFLANGW